jgi:hypothetical protein
MTTYGRAPDPSTVAPWPGAPRFFVWYFQLEQATIGALDPQTGQITDRQPIYLQGGTLAIYGFAARSPYPEDRAYEQSVWEQRAAFCAWCYSRIEPEGNLGFVALNDDLTEITQEQFEAGLRQIRGDSDAS